MGAAVQPLGWRESRKAGWINRICFRRPRSLPSFLLSIGRPPPLPLCQNHGTLDLAQRALPVLPQKLAFLSLAVALEMNARYAFLAYVAGFPLVGLAHSECKGQ
jgi:hypothetical protein